MKAAAAWASLDTEGRRVAAGRVRNWRINNPEKYILLRLRPRATRLGVPFNLDEEDVRVPTHCPVLGIPLDIATVGQSDNSPSVDRIVAKLGYVKGNVRVISMKANRIKNDATVEELQLVLADLRRLHGRRK